MVHVAPVVSMRHKESVSLYCFNNSIRLYKYFPRTIYIGVFFMDAETGAANLSISSTSSHQPIGVRNDEQHGDAVPQPFLATARDPIVVIDAVDFASFPYGFTVSVLHLQ